MHIIDHTVSSYDLYQVVFTDIGTTLDLFTAEIRWKNIIALLITMELSISFVVSKNWKKVSYYGEEGGR